MKIGVLSTPNSKGQVVIPKKIRDELNITNNTILHISSLGGYISMVPITGILTKKDASDSYAELLKKTQGAWTHHTKVIDKRQKTRKKIELQASIKRKKSW